MNSARAPRLLAAIASICTTAVLFTSVVSLSEPAPALAAAPMAQAPVVVAEATAAR